MLPIKIILNFIPVRSVKIHSTRGIEVCGLEIHSDKALLCLWCRMVVPHTMEASFRRKPITNENFRGLKQKRVLAAATHVNPAEEDFFFASLNRSGAQILDSLSFAYTANGKRQILVENFSK